MDDYVVEARAYYKKVGESSGEQNSIIERDDQGLDYMEEMNEDLVYKADDNQYFPSLLPSSYATREEGKFLSQLIRATVG